MLNELNEALADYQTKWHAFAAARKDQEFFAGLKPTAVGWKVTDRAEYDQMCAELHDLSDHVVETWMNGRWIAKFHLRDQQPVDGLTIIKVMQRRPGSEDAVGLDHLDFYSPAVEQAEAVLAAEDGVKWSRESNDIIAGYDWISVWFDGTEAKLKTDTVLDIIAAEMKQLSRQIAG